MRPAIALLLSLLLLSVGLVGCGYQLRGSVNVPPGLSPVFVRGGGLVGRSVETRLAGSGVQSTTDPRDAGLVIDILSQDRDSRVVAVDSGGKALAYMLTYRVKFAATDRQGQFVIKPQVLSLDRTFDDNPNVSVLGEQEESDIIYSDMADDAADQVLLRLRAALANRPAAAAAGAGST
ncbi:MAG: LPS assembly lipoprotein LptE [Thiohalocapsa sp.]|uniref:LPS-assembly lipoprotein LptE n=1 Tax=Thiohalocapsa sp. TaxID=2497641 RepID=UPI0025D281A7|nr:LPS assembly lipoprotein LptE [Thiohalocapsa sp.]MCG6942482.1 LPS assembly lipoprotein LptE [Thiohalocapsa sp.]